MRTGGAPRRRERAGAAVAVLVTMAGVACTPAYGPPATLPASVTMAAALGVLAAWPQDGRRVAAVTGGAGLVSLAATAAVRSLGADVSAPGWPVGESASLLVLIVLVVRTAPPRHAPAAAGLAGVATPALLLRFEPGPPTIEALAGFAVWGLSAALAATIGLYLRSLDGHRARAVRAARRAQRTRLARDLHDFVAHDVSGMLAQAQVGRILAERDPRQAVAAFERIEQAALQALASMDRTVRMLHEADDAADEEPADRAPPPALANLRELADRFASSGTAVVRLDIDAGLADPDGGVPREVSATAYRVVVEALTNVRRHAVAASRVEVAVHRTRVVGFGPALEVTVTDDARPGPAPVRHLLGGARGGDTRNGDTRNGGGFGLAGLAERVEALGGRLAAGPHDPRGWRVTVTLPLAPAPHGGDTRPVTA
ncbi:two-component sensor histidine kinase [Sphaerisporangium rufum]|uniref:histidine kinase n=1 Tax=Sphaerisporangium rufum TaxID=1381558 RepID=A0A919R8D9_9ACTN|nr:ATP-binding protein [Sphaerisporangium rufum]GII81546.1 two-component sensor histidine kinase [Sphaerisporangium rufum]